MRRRIIMRRRVIMRRTNFYASYKFLCVVQIFMRRRKLRVVDNYAS
jgi:hypothetical protein